MPPSEISKIDAYVFFTTPKAAYSARVTLDGSLDVVWPKKVPHLLVAGPANGRDAREGTRPDRSHKSSGYGLK